MNKMLKYMEYIRESDSGTTSDIKINVDGKNYLIQQLIDNLSMVVKKRKMKSIKIKGIKGYINKGIFLSRGGYFYETFLEITLSNKDILIGEYKSSSNNILIKINDEIVFDLNHHTFDNEVLVDKLISQYMKYLKEKKFTVNEAVNPKDEKIVNLGYLINQLRDKGMKDHFINAGLSAMLRDKNVTFCEMEIDAEGDLTCGDYRTMKILSLEYSKGTLVVTDEKDWDYYVNLELPVTIHEGTKEKPKERVRWYRGGRLH